MAAHLDGEHLVAEGAFDVLAPALQYQICHFKGFIIGYLGSCMEIGIGFSFVPKIQSKLRNLIIFVGGLRKHGFLYYSLYIQGLINHLSYHPNPHYE